MLASGVQPGERLASPAHHTGRAYTRAMSTLTTRLDAAQSGLVGTPLGGQFAGRIADCLNVPYCRRPAERLERMSDRCTLKAANRWPLVQRPEWVESTQPRQAAGM